MGRTMFDVLADATTMTVEGGADVTGAVSRVLDGSLDVLGVAASAVLVRTDQGLELLAATSHRVADLEIHQVQHDEGPCVDAVSLAAEVDEDGREAILTRWPTAGRAVVEAGYTSVHAVPLVWRGRCFGALSSFGSRAVPSTADPAGRRLLGHALTLVIAAAAVGEEVIGAGITRALADRAVVEQAKGALAELRGLDMAAAYDALAELARTEGLGMGSAARLVLDRARDGTLA